MVPERAVFVLFALAILAGVTVIGASAFGLAGMAGDGGPDADALVEDALETVRTEPIVAVRNETVERDGERTHRVHVVRERPPDRSVVELVETTGPAIWDTVVINESEKWSYDADDNRVVYDEVDGYWLSDTQSLRLDVRELHETAEATYEGTDTVAGREASVVELTPPDDGTAELSLEVGTGDDALRVPLYGTTDDTWHLARATLWVDTETNYPVKYRTEWIDEDGEPVATTTRTYEEVSVGTEHDDAAFEFDPPPGADVSEPKTPDSEAFEDREAAAEAVPYDLPDLPAEYSLERVTVSTWEDATGATLLYEHEGDLLNVHVADHGMFVDEENAVERGVGEVGATLTVVGDRPQVVWECGELTYRVTGSLEADTLVEVAEAVGC